MKLRRRDAASATVYKLCSLALQYPDAELIEARTDVGAAVEALPRSPSRAVLRRFATWWRWEEALALQQHYVETFDLDKRCGLYLTFFGEGDRRRRGPALVRLKRLYRAAGLPLSGSELPDFLPVMLEFAAAAPAGQGPLVLREHRPTLELLRRSLHERRTPYADVLDAICLALGEPSPAERARTLARGATEPPPELVGLEPSVGLEPGAGLEPSVRPSLESTPGGRPPRPARPATGGRT